MKELWLIRLQNSQQTTVNRQQTLDMPSLGNGLSHVYFKRLFREHFVFLKIFMEDGQHFQIAAQYFMGIEDTSEEPIHKI